MSDRLSYMMNLMKQTRSLPLSVWNDTRAIGYLKPLTYFDLCDDRIIGDLMTWRNENLDAYLSNEPATFEGTRRWLTKFVLDNPAKMLFILHSADDKPVGHMGNADGLDAGASIEMDNIVRGTSAGDKGIMTLALYDLISWVFQYSDLDKVYLRVFSDNLRAINLYRRLKFEEKKKFRLTRTVSDDITRYAIGEAEEGEVKDKYFSYMELSRSVHFENYSSIKKRV